MEFYERIRKRREELGITQAELAEVLGYKSRSTIAKIETGINDIVQSQIIAFADALKTTPAYLMGWTDNPNEKLVEIASNLISLKKVRYIPVIGRIACGTPILAQENIVDHILLPDHIKADFALQAVGDSMTGAQIDDRDYVYIRSQPEVENGEIAAVLIGENATLKKVYIENEKLTLLPANPKHDPIVYVKDEIKQVSIIGKAVAVLKDIE